MHYWRWSTHGSPTAEVWTPQEVCKVDGCDEPHNCKGYCLKHYTRWKRHGAADDKVHSFAPLIERLRRYVDASNPDACWEWTGYRNNRGYGKIDRAYAHRTSYEVHVGPIPDGMEVMHSCDNPPCINPRHLSLGTHLDNMRDMARKGRSRRGRRREAREARA